MRNLIGALALSAVLAGPAAALTVFEMSDFPGVAPGFDIGTPGEHNQRYEDFALGATITASVAGGVAVAALVTGLISRRLDRRAAREGGVRVELEPSAGGFALRF